MVMKNILAIIDMQNDFITGKLANPAAQEIVPGIISLIKNGKYDHIFATRDTHFDDEYAQTLEGQKLPILHCVYKSYGWQVENQIDMTALEHKRLCDYTYINKSTFGSLDWTREIGMFAPEEITLVGTCTNICVVSNVLILRAIYPNARIIVYGNLCAGTSVEEHNAALNVMKSCQIEVLNYET